MGANGAAAGVAGAMRTPAVRDADLYGLSTPIHPDPGLPWWVIHTRPRQEKALAETLRAARLHVFLPIVREQKVYGHRKRVVERPLFPSYLFLEGSREEAWFADGTRRVATIIEPPSVLELAIELESIRRAVSCGAVLDPYPYLTEGRRVRVRSGPFKGVEGVVDVRSRVDRLVLRVNALGRAVALELDAGVLEPVD